MPEKYRVICLRLDKLKATVASIKRIAIEKRMIFSLHSFKNILINIGSSPLFISPNGQETKLMKISSKVRDSTSMLAGLSAFSLSLFSSFQG
jgi:hypothetical protein